MVPIFICVPRQPVAVSHGALVYSACWTVLHVYVYLYTATTFNGVAWCTSVFRLVVGSTLFRSVSLLVVCTPRRPIAVSHGVQVYSACKSVLHVVIVCAPRQPLVVSHGAQVHSALWSVLHLWYSASWTVYHLTFIVFRLLDGSTMFTHSALWSVLRFCHLAFSCFID